MGKNENAKLIFDIWKAKLQASDKTWNSVGGNFEALFLSFQSADVSFTDAFEYLEKAIKAHLPTPSLSKRIYKRCKVKFVKTEAEFHESWVEGTRQKALVAFSNVYPMMGMMGKDDTKSIKNVTDMVSTIPTDEDGPFTPAMKAQQQDYLDSFPTLDLDSIPDIDLSDFANKINVLGDKDGNAI